MKQVTLLVLFLSTIALLTVSIRADCVDDDPNCSNEINLCNNTQYEPLMKKHCAKTCGFCTVTSTTPFTLGPCVMGECPDGYTCSGNVCVVSATTQSPSTCQDYATNCKSLEQYCTDADYYPIMKQNCELTCGFCGQTTTTLPSPSGPCVMNQCPSNLTCINQQCYNVPSMTTTPMTTTTSSTCRDYATNCADLLAYCQTAGYENIMQEQCAKTCGFCH
uniref:ShKT domain-containing protein n=1 Tax=Parastrongyloides trichosuri TaxID=131310 RepID=A0A0N4Z934_PARTI